MTLERAASGSRQRSASLRRDGALFSRLLWGRANRWQLYFDFRSWRERCCFRVNSRTISQGLGQEQRAAGKQEGVRDDGRHERSRANQPTSHLGSLTELSARR
jgi:hypothetical protein